MPELQEGAAELEAKDPDFEAQSTEELGKTLDKMESEAAQDAPTSVMEGEKKPSADEQPPKWFQEYKEQQKRELSSYRDLASLKDRIPAMMREELKRAALENAKQQQLQNLSPEDKQRAQEESQQLEALNKLIAEKSEAALQEKFGNELSYIKEEREKQSFLGQVAELVGTEKEYEVLAPHFDALFKSKIADIYGTDEQKSEAAKAWYIRAKSEPSFLVLEGVRAQSKSVNGKAQNFVQEREQAGREAGQSPRSSSVDAKGGKPLQAKSQADLDAMSTEELAVEFEKVEKAGLVSKR